MCKIKRKSILIVSPELITDLKSESGSVCVSRLFIFFILFLFYFIFTLFVKFYFVLIYFIFKSQKRNIGENHFSAKLFLLTGSA